VGDAGTVTVDVSGMDVTLAETSLADGWEVTERESGGEVELDIVNAASSTSIGLDADIEDGRVRYRCCRGKDRRCATEEDRA